MATVSFNTGGTSHVELPLRQFDADQYMAMAVAGVFAERRRVELIGGYIVDMSPAGPVHNYVIMRLPRLFAPLLDSFELWIQGTLYVDQRHVFDPDFMLLKPRHQSYRDSLPTTADVALVVEVSASSLNRDLDVKLPVYAKQGIPEYWIADVDRNMLIVHREPRGTAYRDMREYAVEDAIAPLATSELEIRVIDIFR